MFNISSIINRFNKQPQLFAPVKFRLEDGYHYLEKIPVKTKDNICFAEVGCNLMDDFYIHKTRSMNKRGKIIGSHTYKLHKLTSTLDGGCIETMSDYRDKGIGEIMRLVSIMQMDANNLNKTDIWSKPQAVLFHFKYGLRPNFSENEDIEQVLSFISSNENSVKGFADKAKILLETVKNQDCLSYNKNLIAEINKFVTYYIQQNKQRWYLAKFAEDIPMTLNYPSIKRSACFYNNLFKKHGIDYKV